MALSTTLDFHAQALGFRSRRAGVLATNIANGDTPGYKARDLDFHKVLGGALQGPDLKITHQRHLGNPVVSPMAVTYRTPSQPSLDGNTVDMPVEQAAFTENAIRYQASLRFLDGRIKSILSALRGE